MDSGLYAKYGLTDEEISFIESTIKPMEKFVFDTMLTTILKV